MLFRRSIILLLFTYSLLVNAQTKEVGIFTGYSNLISDVGHNDPISPFESDLSVNLDPAVGVFYKKVINPRLLWKVSLSYATIRADDANSARLDRKNRLDIDNKTIVSSKKDLYEAALTVEYNFFDIYNDLHKSTPYIFGGLAGAFTHKDLDVNITFQRKNVGGVLQAPTSDTDFDAQIFIKKYAKPTLVIPFGLGYKFRIKEKFMLGIEYGVRATFNDNLDNSNPKKIKYDIDPGLLSSAGSFAPGINTNIEETLNRARKGNTSNFDLYTFTGLTFSYLFGEAPCYCK